MQDVSVIFDISWSIEVDQGKGDCMTGLSQASVAVLGGAEVSTLAAISPAYKVRLFKNDFVPTGRSVLADFVEADFTGYAQYVGSNFSGPYTFPGSADLFSYESGVVFFDSGDCDPPQPCYGWFVKDQAGTHVLAWGVFDAPVVFVKSGDTLEFVLSLVMPSNTGLS